MVIAPEMKSNMLRKQVKHLSAEFTSCLFCGKVSAKLARRRYMATSKKPTDKPKKSKAKNKGGRPSKFDKSKEAIKIMALKGFTDKEMAGVLGITQQTLDNWKKKDKRFFGSLKDWKAQADQQVERSLYARACGYSHQEDKFFNVDGDVFAVETIKHYPPDTTAAIFWLKNRQPLVWRDRHQIEQQIKHNHEMSPEMRDKLDEIYGKKPGT